MRIKKAFTALVLAVVIGVPAIAAKGEITDEDIGQARQEQQNTADELEKTKKEVADLKNSTNNVLDYIRALDSKLSEISNMLNSLNKQLTDKQNEIDDNTVKLEEARKDSVEQYNAMKLRIKFMYEHNAETYLDILLDSKDMGDMLNKAEYISQITTYDRQMLEKYVDTENFIVATETKLKNDLAEIQTMKKSVEQQNEELSLVQKAKEEELSQLNVASAKAQQYQSQLELIYAQQDYKISQMVTDKEQQDRELAKKRAEQEAAQEKVSLVDPGNDPGDDSGPSDSPVSSVGFIWPTGCTRITAYFGEEESFRTHPHEGLDIGASTPGVWGDPIWAAKDGIVSMTGWDDGGGNWVWVYHGDGMYSVYMHNQNVIVSEGDYVKQGQVISYMGSTGNSTGAHLHFAVYMTDHWVDPLPYLPHVY